MTTSSKYFFDQSIAFPLEVLSVNEMANADSSTIESGTKGVKLMESAGRAVAKEIAKKWKKMPVIILAGPGNNGGDGFVVARLLKQKGWQVKVYLLTDANKLKGDAKTMAQRWVKSSKGKINHLDNDKIKEIIKNISFRRTIIVDAIFGAGLNRPLKGTAKKLIDSLSVAQGETQFSVIAVDVPSGISGDSGKVLGKSVLPADLTVTFCRLKPAHLLLPGSAICGDVCLGDIGIKDETVEKLGCKTFINAPPLWVDRINWPNEFSNKYTRGHLLVMGGERMTGAARLAAMGARRAGAGLVSIACSKNSFNIYATASEAGTIILPFDGIDDFKKIISDKRKNAIVIGPGAGESIAGVALKDLVLAAISSGANVIIDADGINAFAKNPKKLFAAIKKANKAGPATPNVMLTPHAGEFVRLFPDIAGNLGMGKLEMARAAASISGAVVVFKGSDTVIAAPDGMAMIDSGVFGTNPWLASAGSGDVLAGMIGAVAASSGDFDNDGILSAAQAVWMHARAGAIFGPGLVAEDIVQNLPAVWDELSGTMD